ncbi:MAG: hypothetical protein PVJ26_20300, partial [Anaerolineae bacterium]
LLSLWAASVVSLLRLSYHILARAAIDCGRGLLVCSKGPICSWPALGWPPTAAGLRFGDQEWRMQLS